MPGFPESCLQVAQALVTASGHMGLGKSSVLLPLSLLCYIFLLWLATKASLPPPRDQPVARAHGHGVFPQLPAPGPHRCLPCRSTWQPCPHICMLPSASSAFSPQHLSSASHSVLPATLASTSLSYEASLPWVTSTSAQPVLSLTSIVWTLPC